LEDDAEEAEAAAEPLEEERCFELEFFRGLGANAFCLALEAPITLENEEDSCCWLLLCRPPDML